MNKGRMKFLSVALASMVIGMSVLVRCAPVVERTDRKQDSLLKEVEGRTGMRVDLTTRTAQVAISLPEGELVVSLNPLVNLVIHTMNMYDLLGLHGQDYALKNDPRARQAVDAGIFESVAGQDRCFGAGTLNIYLPTMHSIVSTGLYKEYPEERLLREIAPQPFDVALTKSWNGFYKAYWDDNFGRLVEELEEMNARMRWAERLTEMERFTGVQWSGQMNVFTVEATAGSALKWGENVCIGTLARDHDAGFVHEGLHLLLKGRWAHDPRIRAYMASRTFHDDFWGESWQEKYEQAVVVALDIHVRRDMMRQRYRGLVQSCRARGTQAPTYDDFVRRYFESNKVGDLFDVVWPLVSAYVAKPERSFGDLMYSLIVKGQEKTSR